MAKKQLGAIDPELIEKIDRVRGDVPRIRWVERALEKALSGVASVDPQASDKPPRGLSSRDSSGPASSRASRPPISAAKLDRFK